jgi:hypothetical protein
MPRELSTETAMRNILRMITGENAHATREMRV